MSVDPPERLLRRYADWTWTVAWNLVPFATTWRLERAGEAALYAKVCALPPVRDERPLFVAEAARMLWARGVGLPVPVLVGVGDDGDVDWLLSEAIDGEPAERHPRRAADPLGVASELAGGLRLLHEVPVRLCPFDRTLDVALEVRRRRLADGLLSVDTMHPGRDGLSPRDGLARLERDRPATEDLVVCHRDFNEANTLLADDGSLAGIVDLGLLGLGDRWCDLAVTSWYLEGNHGAEAAAAFFAAYGIDPDPQRIDYYRLLYSVA
jgi:kanamycin kinase